MWSEYSFILKPSVLGGIGVFAVHDIPAETKIFGKEHSVRVLKAKDIPTDFIKYCVYINDEECLCPQQFDRMEIGWYINHSYTPNIENRKVEVIGATVKSNVYTVKNIKAGDEILMNYNDLGEPEQCKEDYYNKTTL